MDVPLRDIRWRHWDKVSNSLTVHCILARAGEVFASDTSFLPRSGNWL